MILEITYGYKVESVDDPFLRLAEDAANESSRFGSLGGTAPCDIVPIREHNFTLLLSIWTYDSNVNVTKRK